jgi:hypothetical protein
VQLRRKHEYLIAMVALSLMTAAYEAVTSWGGAITSTRLLELSSFASLILLVLWVDTDSRAQSKIYRPFEHGWLALFCWMPYLPYYFWRTRGIRGLLMLVGLLCVLLSARIVQWLAYVVRSG